MSNDLQDSPMHKALFWVAVAVLQLDEVSLYSAGTALLEQNLHTLDSLRVFNDKVPNWNPRLDKHRLKMCFDTLDIIISDS